MNSYRRGLRNGVLVNSKLFIFEKFNFGQHIKCWSNLVKLSQTWSNVFKLVLFGAGHYIFPLSSGSPAVFQAADLRLLVIVEAFGMLYWSIFPIGPFFQS